MIICSECNEKVKDNVHYCFRCGNEMPILKENLNKKIQEIYTLKQAIENNYTNFEVYLGDYVRFLTTYREYCCLLFDIANLEINNEDIIKNIFYKTIGDYNKKIFDKSFYRSNCYAFTSVTVNIIDTIRNNYMSISNSQTTVDDYRKILNACLRDGIAVISDYYFYVKKQRAPINIIRSGLQHERDIYNTSLQVIYGQNIFSDWSDNAIYASVALIRVSIELRLRRSMGIFGLYNTKNDAILPLTMSDFFSVLKKFISTGEVDIILPIDLIERIYNWCNIYIHGGINFYVWLPMIATRFLRPLFSGDSIDNGVWTNEFTIKKFQRAIKFFKKSMRKKFFYMSNLVILQYGYTNPFILQKDEEIELLELTEAHYINLESHLSSALIPPSSPSGRAQI